MNIIVSKNTAGPGRVGDGSCECAKLGEGCWAGLGWAELGCWVLYHHLTFSSGCQHGAAHALPGQGGPHWACYTCTQTIFGAVDILYLMITQSWMIPGIDPG